MWFQKNTQNLTKFYKENFLNSFFHEPDLHIVFKNKKYLSSFKEDIFPTSESSGFLIKRKKIIDIPSFKKGNWWVQDFSSSFPLTCIENKIIENQSIDLCAAPGGKSFQIISRGENIILNDKNKERIKLLEENLKRLKYKAKIINNDVTSLNDKEKFNFIILDAPCSAVGTIRKNPEIFFKSEEPKLSYLVELQKKMLDKAASITKKNGIILYMVCSFLQIETTNQVKNFLKRNNTFSTYKFSNNNKSLYYDNLIKDAAEEAEEEEAKAREERQRAELLKEIRGASMPSLRRLNHQSLSNLARDKLLYSGATSDLEKAKGMLLPSTAHPFIHPKSYRDVDEIYKSLLSDYIDRMKQIHPRLDKMASLGSHGHYIRPKFGGHKKSKRKYYR